jgi:hypothetical protein
MLRPCATGTKEFSDFQSGHLSAAGPAGFVQDKNSAILVATKPPAVAVLAVVNLALVRHGALQQYEIISPCIRSACPPPAVLPIMRQAGLFGR